MPSWIYRCTLYFFVFLFVCSILGALYDILQQFLVVSNSSKRWSRFYNGITAAALFLLFAILSAWISISRLVTVKRTLASIPKGYVPITKDDVPKPVYRLISQEYARCAAISYASIPRNRTQPGWGKPTTEFDNVHIRSAIISTRDALDQLLENHANKSSNNNGNNNSIKQVKAPSFTSTTLPRPSTTTALPLARKLQDLLPESYQPLISLYGHLLDDALYGRAEPTERDYLDAVRLFGVLASSLEKSF